jgi:exopolyphosphatase/guanosine-5'-triphosphate,3'-diphosphate pyrophosphatase
VRDSRNRKQFLKAARATLGFPVQLLSGDEEGNKIFAGVAADVHWRKRDLMVVDVGGGSAEWVQGKKLRVEQRISLPLGCVRLRERFDLHYPVGKTAVTRLCAMLHEQLQPALADFQLARRVLVGTGGTATALAAMELKLRKFDPAKVDHFTLTRAQVYQRLEKLAGLTWHQLLKVPGLPAKRTDLIIPGAAVFYVTMEILGARQMKTSVRGLRYGVMHDLIHGTSA